MIDLFFQLIDRLDSFLWGPWTMMLIAFVSAYLTVKSRFFQISHFKYILSETFFKIFNRTESSSKSSISPFQATTASLAGTVGMGNMAGVATALSIGGPGAIFWMLSLIHISEPTRPY